MGTASLFFVSAERPVLLVYLERTERADEALRWRGGVRGWIMYFLDAILSPKFSENILLQIFYLHKFFFYFSSNCDLLFLL